MTRFFETVLIIILAEMLILMFAVALTSGDPSVVPKKEWDKRYPANSEAVHY